MANELQKPSGSINIFNFRRHIAYIEQAESRIDITSNEQAEQQSKLDAQAEAQAKQQAELDVRAEVQAIQQAKLDARAEAQAKQQSELDKQAEELAKQKAALDAREKELANLEISLAQFNASLEDRDRFSSDIEWDLRRQEASLKGREEIVKGIEERFSEPIQYQRELDARNRELDIRERRLDARKESLDSVEIKQRKIADEQAKKSEEQARITKEQARIDEEQAARTKSLDDKQKNLIKTDMFIKRQPVGVGNLSESEMMKMAKRQKNFEIMITRAIEEFRPTLQALNQAESLTESSLASERKFELYRFKAKILGTLAAYIYRDPYKTSSEILKSSYYSSIQKEMDSMVTDIAQVETIKTIETPIKEIRKAYVNSLLYGVYPDLKEFAVKQFYGYDTETKKEYASRFYEDAVGAALGQKSNDPRVVIENINRGMRESQIRNYGLNYDELLGYYSSDRYSSNITSGVAYGTYKEKMNEFESEIEK